MQETQLKWIASSKKEAATYVPSHPPRWSYARSREERGGRLTREPCTDVQLTF